MAYTTMPSQPRLTYQATEPPSDATCTAVRCESTRPADGARCSMRGCGTVAEVRLLMQSHRVEKEGGNAAHSSRTFDACDLHWPRMRDACLRGGHQVVDTTGDLAELAAGCPDWNVFRSDSGRLYASTRLDRLPLGTTVHAWLVGQLHARIANAAAARGVSAPGRLP